MNLIFSKPDINDIMNQKGFIMPAFIDLTNQKFGRLKVINRSNINLRNKPAWECLCECGNITLCAACDLRSGDKKSCGCLRKDLLRIDLIGKKFGKLIILKTEKSRGKSTAQFWLCKCDCGKNHVASSQHLRLGFVTSCGCLKNIDCEKYKSEFFENIEKTDGCWNWKGRLARGYGIFFAGKLIKAHRFSYLLHKGKIKNKYLICHTCDNSLCVNPEHLYEGTYKDNAQDRERRFRGKQHKSLKVR